MAHTMRMFTRTQTRRALVLSRQFDLVVVVVVAQLVRLFTCSRTNSPVRPHTHQLAAHCQVFVCVCVLRNVFKKPIGNVSARTFSLFTSQFQQEEAFSFNVCLLCAALLCFALGAFNSTKLN